MKLYTSEHSREADKYAIEQMGIPSVVLMEHASRGVFEEIVARFPNVLLNNFIVLYGTGNNGGDALSVARMLLFAGCKVNIVEAVGAPKTSDSQLQMDMLLKTAHGKDNLKQITKSEVSKYINDNTIVLDGVFGTGFKAVSSKPLEKALVKLFKEVRKAPYIISIDIPSGVDSDTGEVAPGAIEVDCTISFIFPKVGLFIAPASIHAGDVIVKPLFFPVKHINTNYELITEHFAKELIAPLKRTPNSHKGTYGHVAIISPDKGMEGAVAMSAMAALKSGAGLVTVLAVNETTDVLRQRMSMLTPEIMVSSIKIDDKTGSELMNDFKKFNSVVVGPGFGKERKTILKKILEYVAIPMVIDADALNLISNDHNLFDIIRNKNAILTPHPGEMSRLFPEIKDVQEHRLVVLEKYVKGQKFSLLLKGYRSMLGRGDGHVFVNYTGNPSLSKGGSGDVLSGLIASFNAQGLEIWKAGVLGMYVHGLCADRLVMEDKNSDFGILPTDIINEMGPVIRCLTE